MSKVNNIKAAFAISLSTMIFILSSCKKYVEVPVPKDQIITENAFKDDATATATVVGIYSEMMNNAQLFSSAQTTLLTGMSADELYYYTPGFRDEFRSNQLSPASHSYLSNYFWQPAYRFIYAANLSIAGLEKSQGITGPVKNTLLGEAKFIRAFCFFQLVNLFGDVPLTLSADFRVNGHLPRSEKSIVFEQIINDLLDARNLLNANYPSLDRARPNRLAASALLARVYLYAGQWDKAEAEATTVMSAGVYNLITNPNNVFLKSSTETIWQLIPVNPTVNTWEGNSILPALSTTQPTFLLTNDLMNAFEPGDQRRSAWVGTRNYLGQTLYYPTKYKVYGNSAPLTEGYIILRLAEQYLIRSEARANQNNLPGAIADLNKIRNRASLASIATTDLSTVLTAIEHERKIELMCEWAHRWYDLKRTDRADTVLGLLKPSTWQSTDALWPIPNDQILLNNKLTQNAGY